MLYNFKLEKFDYFLQHGNRLKKNIGIMIPINDENFYFETNQEKIQMKKIFFILSLIVMSMVAFLEGGNISFINFGNNLRVRITVKMY